MRKVIVAGVVLLLFLGIPMLASGAISYTLRVLEQQVSGSNFQFKIYLQSTGDNLLYLAASQIYLNFNHGNFSSDAASVLETGGDLETYYTVDASIDGNNRIAIQIDAPTVGSETQFNQRVTLISTSGNGTYIGQFQISTIENTEGTAGLAWYYDTVTPANGTDIFYFDDSDPWDTHRITTYSNVDPEDTSLPVQMSDFSASASPEEGIILTWRTESETNCLGFHVWKSEDGDDDYERITTALIPGHGNSSTGHEYTFTDSNVQAGIVYWYKIEEVSTDGTSRFYGPVSIEGIDTLPAEFALSQNYPNPFNPETVFRYQVPEDCEVTITVYSLLGKRVAGLVNERKPAGFYRVRWDGTDDYRRKVSSGIYLLRMEAEGFTQMRKMTIVR